MKKLNKSYLLILNELSLERIKAMSFLSLPWRQENVGVTKEDYETLHGICYDLLLMDFAQVLFNTGNTSLLDKIIGEDNIGRKILQDSIKSTAINLRLSHFTRLIFVANILEDEVLDKNYHIKIFDSLDDSSAKRLFQVYTAFLRKWIFSPLFLSLFALKYKQNIDVPEKFKQQWENFKFETYQLFLLFKENFNDLVAIKALYFWLTRLHEANDWKPEQKHFKLFCEKVFNYDDMENNRVFTYADYFDSIMGAQLIREYGNLLNFPIFQHNKLKVYNRNKTTDSIDRQIYDRMSASLIAIQKSSKNEILVKSTSFPDAIINKEFLTIFNFIKYYSSVHFMGHIGELFSYIKAILEIKDYFDSELVVIPGSSITLKGKKGIKQGPDGIIGSIKVIDEKIYLKIYGIIEIKSYRVSPSKLIAQLKKHHKRLMNEKIHILVSGLDKSAVFLSKEASDIKSITIEISNLEFSEDLKYYSFVPAYKRRPKLRKKQNFRLIELPWYPSGFQKMGFYFTFWIIQNFGRIAAENDYNRGVSSWIYLMKRVLKEGKLNRRKEASIRKLLNAFENGIESADMDWVK